MQVHPKGARNRWESFRAPRPPPPLPTVFDSVRSQDSKTTQRRDQPLSTLIRPPIVLAVTAAVVAAVATAGGGSGSNSGASGAGATGGRESGAGTEGAAGGGCRQDLAWTHAGWSKPGCYNECTAAAVAVGGGNCRS